MNKILTGFLTAILFAVTVACSGPAPDLPNPDHVEAVTAGLRSRKDPVTVVFTKPLPGGEAGRTLPASPFQITPRIDGVTTYVNERTVIFKPHTQFSPNTLYDVRVNPAVLGLEIDSFHFRFRTVEPKISLQPGTLQWNGNTYFLDVEISTLDKEDSNDLIKSVQVFLAGQSLPIELPNQTTYRHRIRLRDLKPTEKDQELKITWSNQNLGGKDSGQIALNLPASHSFRFLGQEFSSQGSLILSFNKNLQPDQDWNRLLKINTPYRVRVVGNLLEILPLQASWPEEVRFEVGPGLQTLQNQVLEYTAQGRIDNSAQRLPKVEWASPGNIVAPDDLAVVPIKTTNLRGVVVEAIQIFDNNVNQFFQVNNYDSNSELVRVGRAVWREAVRLPWNAGNLNREVVHLLDLRPLIEKVRANMYHLRISFLPNQVEYPIQQSEELSSIGPQDLFPALQSQSETNYWEYWDYYEGESGQDPSRKSFYTNFYGEEKIYISKNILVSHIGLSSKMTTDRNLFVWTSDLRTTEPIGGVNVQVFDYQNQLLSQGRTDGQGVYQFRFGEISPYIVIAEHQNRRSFLRVDEVSALSVSHLDVAGDSIDKGLKGFLYGERGVWRPGDTVYLNFILLDKNKTLPPNHPISLTIKDPKRNIFLQQVKTENLDGFYSFSFKTNPESPTGTWNAAVTAGGRTFSMNLPVEAVVPNRLRATVNVSGYLKPGSQVFDLVGTWLHGAPASNLSASITANFSPKPTRFEGFFDFIFEDPLKSNYSNTETLWSGRLDAQGRSVVRTNIPSSPNAPGLLNARLEISITEPSGAVSVDRQTIDFSPFSSYVGLQVPPGDAVRGMLLTDTDHPIRIVVLDSDGKPITGPRQVRVEFFKINWRWWWDSTGNIREDFESREGWTSIASQTVNIVQGRGQWNLRVNYPEWGRYYLRVTDTTSGHSAGKIFYIDWPGWAGRAMQGADGAAVLVLSSDKKTYNVGETATVNFASSAGARALITIEGGGRILRQEWVPTAAETTRYSFRVENGMAPNVYVHASLIQPIQAQNQRPLRLYGSVPLMIEDPTTRIQPIIESADTFQPQTRVRVAVREARGQPMTYTLALVDEGLLGLTGYKTPNPWDTFYRREASLVKHFDLFDFVLRSFTAQAAQRIRIGGSGEDAVPMSNSLGRYPPLVRFIGPVSLAAGARNNHEIDLPLYIGAVRLMVVAGRQGTAFGSTEKSVIVKKDLMVLGTLPRILAPSEVTDYPVTVFWSGSGAANVNVTARVTGPGNFTGESSRIVRFTGPGEQTIRFNLNVSGTGLLRVSASAVTTNDRADHVIEIQSRIPTNPIFQVSNQTVAPGQTTTFQIASFGIPQTNKITLEVSRLVPLDIGRRLSFLITYPYGCVEQIVSTVFPQLYLNTLMRLNQDDAEKIRNNVTQAIIRLKSYQNSNGSFAYWPGTNLYYDWANNYSGHFLIEARRLGYFIEPQMLNSWIAYQKSTASSFQGRDKEALRNQAYRLYLLALAGSPMLPEMNRLREQNLEGLSQLQLASAYQLAGQATQAQALATRVSLDVAEYKETGGTFGSSLRDRAVMLESLSNLGDQARASELARQIGQALVQGNAYSTQETAFSLLAIGRFFERFSTGGAAGVTYDWKGQNRNLQLGDKVVLQENLDPGSGPLTVTNSSGVPLYVRVIQEAQPTFGQEPSVTRGIAAAVTYTDANSRPLAITSLTQGAQIRVAIRIANLTPNRLENVALSWLIPAGWDLINPRLSGSSGNSGAVYEDYRDDRVNSFLTLGPRQSVTLTYNAMTTYAGRFYLPALYLGPMYNPEVQAVIPGQWVTVRSE